MTPLFIALLSLAIVATSFLSGLFGMAGGMILMGILIAVMPLPAAMVLHAVTQMASNGWRAALWWRHIRWRPVGFFLFGAVLALGLWSLTLYVPSKPVAYIFLGVTPILLYMPANWKPNPESSVQAGAYGLVSMTLMLISGVFWHNHACALTFYRKDFLPMLPDGYRHLEVGPGHGALLHLTATEGRSGSISGWDVSEGAIAATRRTLSSPSHTSRPSQPARSARTAARPISSMASAPITRSSLKAAPAKPSSSRKSAVATSSESVAGSAPRVVRWV